MRTWSFAKGHGTGNDFVLLLDRTGTMELDPATVRYLCDRHLGIGGDGVIRAVPGRYVDGWSGDPDVWFMDYRNADGSVAEMCGNGVRVFARYLIDHALADGPDLVAGTRSGARCVTARPDGLLRAEIGPVRVLPGAVEVAFQTATGPAQAAGVAVDVGNPHVVVTLADADALAALDLSRAPVLPPERCPEGANVEFVVVTGHDVAMRVFERGVGETCSCGTGTVAAAAASAARAKATDSSATAANAAAGTWQVGVPGGRLIVDLPEQPGDPAWLTGPAVLVAHGEVFLP